MLYTVRPLERIYHDWNTVENDTETLEYKEFDIENGTLVGKKQDDYYIVDRVISSDLEDYLDEKYQPGCRID